MWKCRKEQPKPQIEGSYWVYLEGYGTYVCPFWKTKDEPSGTWLGQQFEYWFDSVMNLTHILNQALETYKPTPFEPERSKREDLERGCGALNIMET